MQEEQVELMTFLPTDPKELDEISRSFDDMVVMRTKVDQQNVLLSEAKKFLKEKYKLDISMVNDVLDSMHKNNYREKEAKREKTTMLYETLLLKSE